MEHCTRVKLRSRRAEHGNSWAFIHDRTEEVRYKCKYDRKLNSTVMGLEDSHAPTEKNASQWSVMSSSWVLSCRQNTVTSINMLNEQKLVDKRLALTKCFKPRNESGAAKKLQQPLNVGGQRTSAFQSAAMHHFANVYSNFRRLPFFSSIEVSLFSVPGKPIKDCRFLQEKAKFQWCEGRGERRRARVENSAQLYSMH